MYGQMNEPPGARARVALTGLTVAEYFRDEEGQDVLLFIDNIFRFVSSCSHVVLSYDEKNSFLVICIRTCVHACFRIATGLVLFYNNFSRRNKGLAHEGFDLASSQLRS